MIDYLIRYSNSRDRLEGRRFIESSSLSQQASQVVGGDMYAKRQFIEDPTLSQEMIITKEGDVKVRALWEIIEPDDIDGLIYWLEGTTNISTSVRPSYPNNPYVNTWSTITGSVNYTDLSGSTGTVDGAYGPLTYRIFPPFLASTSLIGKGVYFWYQAGATENLYVYQPMVDPNAPEYDVPLTIALMNGRLSSIYQTLPALTTIFCSSSYYDSCSLGLIFKNDGYYTFFGTASVSASMSHPSNQLAVWTVDENQICHTFVNGVKSSPFSGSSSKLSVKTLVGSSIDVLPFLSTVVYEICIWNRVLTDTEIRDLNNGYFYPKYKGIAADPA